MSVLRAVYLIFAVVGAVYPMIAFGSGAAFFGDAPLSVLMSALEQNTASRFSWELILSATVLSIWALAEVYVRKNWLALAALPATWFIGIACGLPLYLFLRTQPAR